MPAKYYPDGTEVPGTRWSPADEVYILKRDSKELFRGTEVQCSQWIHRNTPYSVSHATMHEGYKIKSAIEWRGT